MPTTVEIPGVGLVDYPDGMSDEAIAQAAGELHRKALAAQKPAMPALHDVFVQGAGDLIGSPIPGRTPETMGLPTSPEPMSLLTPEQSSQLEGLNRVLENLGSMGDIPGALLNRVMEGASRRVATSGKSALGLSIQPAIDIAQGNLPSLNPAENFARFNKSPLAKAITEGTEEQSKYYNDKFEAMGIGPDLKPIVDFVGNAAGSTLVSIAALPAGLPGLIASSIGTFAPSFEDALNKGASPNKAFAHAVISTGAEAGSEYLGGAAARTSKFLGKMPFLPDAFRKFLDVAPRDALKDAIKEAGMNVFKRLGRTAGMEGLEEVASELAQHVSAAMLYDPTQLTNTTELLTDLFKAFAGGAVGGALFTPIEAKAAKQMLRREVSKGIVDQWQQSVDMAKKEGALRPEDEKSIPAAVSARMWMEIGAQRGDAEMIARGKAELMRALAPSKGTETAQEIGNQTEAEVLQAAEINRSLENPAAAQQMLAQATEQYGADSGIVERLRAAIERAPVINQGFGMAYGSDVAKGEVPSFQRGVPQLGRAKAIIDEKQANADWHKVITNQGYTDYQYELLQGKGYRDNLTDQATDQPSDAKGNPNKEIEGYYDEATKKVVLYQGSIYGGTKRLAEVARHEKLHQAADNPEAQRKIFRFVSEQMPKELAGEVRRLVRLGYRFRDIPEEYLANLYETERWWGEPVDRLRAKLAEWFPKLAPVPPSVAGRILARTLVRSKQEVIPTDEGQKEEAGLQVNPQAEGAAGTAQTEAASTTPPAEQPAAPPAAELSTAKEPANQPAPVEVAPVSAPQETPAAKEPPAPVVKESQTTEPEKPTEPVSPPAETAPKTEAAAEPPPETKPEAKAAPSVEEKKEQPATEAFAKTEPPKEGGNENKPATAKTSGRDPIQVAEEIIRADGNTSASLVQLLQGKMLIHYTQAKHLIAELERRGVIDPNRDAIVQAERDAKAKKEQADLQSELDAELGQVPAPQANPAGRALSTAIRTRLINGETVAKSEIATEGLTAKEAEEWAELGATEAARAIAAGPGTNIEKFDRLVDLYQRMPSQSTRTLETKVGQQYSTPPPLAFAGAVLANFAAGRSFVDPTAGHGMLAIGMPPGSRLLLNERDTERLERLRSSSPDNVTLTSEDATTADFHDRVSVRRPDRVGLNPPFGSVVEGKRKKQFQIINGVTTTERTPSIDIAISLNTLDGMAPNGQAFVIIGSKTGTPNAEFSKNPESRAKAYERPVFLEFFERFNVVDWFTIGGDLYRRMGAGWPVDMIIIRGKGKTPASVVRPWQTPPRVINSWEELRTLIPNEQTAINTSESGSPADTSGTPDRPSDRRTTVHLPATGQSGGGGGARVKPPRIKRPAGRVAVNPGNGQPAGVSVTGSGPGVPAGGIGGAGVSTSPGNAKPDQPLAGSTTAEGGRQASVGAGGGGIPQPSPGPVSPKSSDFGAKNKLVSRERAEELRRLLREKLGRASTGIDPTILANSIELGAYYLEGGIRKFSDWAKAMLEDIGPSARPWLRSVYEGARAFPGEQYSGDMDSPDVVKMLAQQLTETATVTPTDAVSTPQALSADTLVPYASVSNGPRLPLVAPRNMADQMLRALLELQEKVGPLDDYVAGKLGRPVDVLRKQMAASQIEALANAIHNIESGGALIVADETGVGKGRVVAGLIEYALRHNRIPVFVTAKKGLYADMVGRDLVALGNMTFKPWITDASYAYIDGKGNRIVRKSAQDLATQMDAIARSGDLPSGFHGLFTTYDQLKSDRPKGFSENAKQKAARKREKSERPDGPRWKLIRSLAPNSIIILDESHLAAGGDSETNLKFMSVLKRAAGVYYSSATWSKRPDTMGLYAVATSMRLSGLTDEQISDAIAKGGVPMQQAVASMLASNGELMRRQQDWTGIEFQFKTSSSDSAREVESADNYTGFIANLMELAKIINATGKNRVRAENQVRPEEVQVKLEPMQFGSRLFNLSSQYLLSLRVGAVVRESVAALNAGEKPWISLFNTMEGPIQDLQAMGLPLTFNGMLLREMEKMLVITVKDPLAKEIGGKRKVRLKPEELADGGALYYQIKSAVEETNLGPMPVSPIDAIKKGVAAAGFTIGEITARDGSVEENGEEVVVTDREKVARDILLAGFNGDPKYPDAPRFDAMIVNASSGTGLSAHTDPAFTDQRQRHGIIAQPDPDVNGFMQMIGRLNRSGQNSKPKYTVITTSLAAERRFATMLRGKMASLNANTTADSESEMTKGSIATDVFNVVGDGVVHRVLSSNASLADQMGFKLDPHEDPDDGFARKSTGYFVMLRNSDAERLWKLISSEYNDEINRLDEQGTNPLKAEAEDLRARLVERSEIGGGHGASPFDQPVYLEKTEVRPPLNPATWAQASDKAAATRNDLARRAREWISKSRDAENQRVRDAATPDLAVRIQDNHNEARQAVGMAVQMLGETFGIDPLGTGSPLFHGVVVDVRLKDTDPSDYSSKSRQELVLWTNTYRRKFTIPLSKVEIGKTGSLLIPMESYIAENAFDSNAERDTTRFMMTGNLLAAWELAHNQSHGKARVAIYTRDDGSISTGIIMPPGWSGTGKAQKIIESAGDFERVLREGTTVTSLPTSSVHPIEINGLDLTIPANSRAKSVWGDRKFREFFTYQPQQRGSVFIGHLNSYEIGNLFEYLKGKGVRLANDLPTQPGQKFSIIPTDTRESLVEKDIQWLRGEYQGAPEVVRRINPEEGRGGQPVYYDPGFRQIVVVPRLLPRTRGARRSLFLAALSDAGINLIPESFWASAWEDIGKVDSAMLKQASDALKVDVREASGRRAVLRRLVEQRMSGPTKYGLVRTLLRMFKAEAPTARVVDRIHAEIEKLSESFIPKTPGEFNPQDPRRGVIDPNRDAIVQAERDAKAKAQVFADKNAAAWGLRSFIYGLRDQANQLAYQAIEASQWKRIQDRLNALADQAEAASIGSGRRRFRPDINGSMFMSELSGYGVPFTQADAAAHQTWLEEQEARRVAGLMDSLERNQEVASSLAANFPEYEAEALRATITRKESKLARIEEERPEIYHRANVIRSATEAIPAAKAARDALATPEIADWVETIYQIEQSGVTPRAFDEMGGNLRTDAETAAGMFAHSANTIHGILTERMQESSDKIVRTLRKLHAKRTELRSKQGDADVRVAELMSAIVGDAGASGGLFTREIAEQVRSRELAIGRLAVLLGNASPSTMAAQFREALSSDGEATVDAPVIRHVAADAGITEEVLRDILTLANRDTGFRNAVLMLADEADARASKRVLDVINQIEAVRGNIVGPGPQLPDGPQRAVRDGLLVAREMLGRIRLERSQASATLAEVEKAIEQAEIEQTTIRMLSDLADSAVDMSGGFMSDRIGTAEMVYRTQSNGVHLATFTKADGTTQPAVVFGSGREYTTRMVEDILAWREAALEAARDGTKNPPHVNRGLEIGAQKALEILDAYATPDKILSTAKYQPLNLWLSKQTWAIRQALPRLLPGIHGRAYAEMIAGYARLGRALDDIVAKSHSKRMRLIRSAFESMGLDQYNGIHQAEMAQAYSEIAHRLREHGSTVRVGDTLLSQRLHGTDHGTLTRELLNLIRYDRDIFREAQRVMQSEPYGGIREVLGKLRLVRPAAETGDIGLARRADKMQQRRLAEDYDAEIAVHGKDADLTGLWDKRPDMIRFHILDSTRSDLAFDRNAMIHDLEQQYARDMRSGRVPPPMTIDDTVTQLAAYAGNRIADPLNTIRKAFLGEMAVYARYAKSRTDSKGTSDRPLTGIGTWSGEDDTNEFTSPAAKLVYPSSMYHYGAETTDMRQALANVLDTSQVQVLAAGKAASTALLESVSRISEGPVGTGSMTDEDRAMVLWYNNAKTGTEVTQKMVNRAINRMRQVAAAIDADIKDIQSPTWNAPSLIHKFVGALMPFILTYPRVGISNVFGGPLSTGRILERVVGPQRAFLAMAANTAYSPLFAAYNISDWIIHKATGLNLPRSESTPQTITWLQSIGWSSFFSHAELQAMREHTGGGGIGDAVLRGVVTAGDYLEKTVGRAVGITGTDTHLNRLAASVVVPHVLRQMQRIAIRWQNRLAEANQIAGPDAVGEFAFGTQDSQNADAIREMLRESEVHPEQFLAALANGEIDLRRFYLHPLGAKFGNAVLSDFNAATRTNRPRQRGVLNLLMGWTLYDVSRTVDLLRQPVDRSALKKFMRWSSLGAAMVIGSFYSKVISDFARRGFNEAQTAIAEHIAELLASPPGDDDDLWDWLQNILARLVASFEVHSAPKPMPWEKVWYDRPLLDIAMEVGMAVPGARGLDRLMEGGAVKTPGMGIVFQAAESSVMGVKAVAEALAGKDVEARVDSGAALRAILASFGEYGRVLGNFVVGQPRRESVATIRKAANEAGIPVTPVAMPAGSAVFRATPLRQPLLEAAVGLLDAKPEDATAAKKRLVDVAKAVYQRAYDKVIERGGFSNPIEAKEEADKAGQRAVQSAVSSIEPVTRALGRSVTPDEYVKLKTSGALSNPEVQKETKAVAAAANYLSTIATTGGRSMVNATDSVTSPIRGGGASFGGGLSTGGGGASRSPMGGIGIRRRRLGIARARMPRLRKPKVPKLRSVKMRKPKLPRLR